MSCLLKESLFSGIMFGLLKIKMKKITRFLNFSFLCLGLILLSFDTFASTLLNVSSMEAYGLDTIAGHSTVLRTSKTLPDTEIVFEVKKPNGEIVSIDAETSDKGVAIVDISDYHLKVAGEYMLGAHVQSDEVAYWSSFIVFPGETSEFESSLYPENQVSKSHGEAKTITVNLKDDFGNAIVGHQVKLIGDSTSGEIKMIGESGLTDENGELNFSVSHDFQDTITYTAYDVTADKVLLSKAKVAYLDSAKSLFHEALPTSSYAAGNSSGLVDHLKFEDFPEEINPGESVSLTLTAYDSADQVVTNYEGVVRFSAVGPNASYVALPEDYTFDLADQGSHTFSLAFNFQKLGQYGLRATDLEDISVSAEKIIDVIESSSFSASASEDANITITNPIAGTYSSNLQVISGKAVPGTSLKIFDNGVEIAQLIADIEGDFTFRTELLLDGVHTIYVASVDSDGSVVDASETLKFTIDTSAPEIGEATFSPSKDIVPGTAVRVELKIDDDVSEAVMILDGDRFELEDSGNNSYVGAFAAPIEFGEYIVDFIVTDELGNESKYENYAGFKVGVFPVAEKSYPANVYNLRVTPEDARVILNWDPVTDSVNGISEYRIYYGLSPNELTDAVDTFTSATDWYIPNLVNGKAYYFAVIAVDGVGNVSQEFSNIAKATPYGVVKLPVVEMVELAPIDVFEGSAGAVALNDLERDVADAGPETMWLFVISGLAGYFYSVGRRRCLKSSKHF